jgi:hypothetical protein
MPARGSFEALRQLQLKVLHSQEWSLSDYRSAHILVGDWWQRRTRSPAKSI